MKGKAVYSFAFDVAQDIRTSEVATVLSEKAKPHKIQVGPAAPKDLPFDLPPSVAPPPRSGPSSVGPVTLKPVVKIFDVGVLSISFEIGFDVADLPALIPYHQVQVDGVPLLQKAEELCRRAFEELKPLMVKRAAEIRGPEAYTVFCLETVGGDPSRPVAEWVLARRQELAQMLGEEPAGPPLAPAQ